MTPAFNRPTKGRTAAGRLALFQPVFDRLVEDALAARAREGGAKRQTPSPVLTCVDIGLGHHPITFIEWAEALAPSSTVRLVGIEQDDAYFQVARDVVRGVVAAQAAPQPTLQVLHGSYEQTVTLAPLDVVRIANVWRVYSLAELEEAQRALAPVLSPSGVVVEINCDPQGTIGTATVFTRQGATLVPRDVVFGVANPLGGFAPFRFRDWLPRVVRRTCLPQTPIHTLLTRWTDAWRPEKESPPKDAFAGSAARLAQTVDAVDVITPSLVRWRPEAL